MGRKWNNIKYGKAAKDSARSKILARFGREIYVAAKSGDPDPELNRNLAMVIERAKVAGVNRDIIDRAINKAKSGADESYDPIRYEGYGPSGAAVIVDTLTDNVNRTVAEVRSAFNKNGGKIGVNGAVAFMFEPTALFAFTGKNEEEVMEGLMEADIEVRDIEEEDDIVTVYADFDQFHSVQVGLSEMGVTEFEASELTMLPTSTVTLEGDALEKFMKLIDVLEDLDDVQQVFHNVELPDEE
ncbi:MAG: YebC/PmpR family DNA-binding transcriptional regulator [Turicibacter sp.]|nr:YebC/PmpR family DNA-binding transcriptional regulator [Turicibacter sp.]